MSLDKEHIKNQFITNPVWKELFLKHFPLSVPETYIEDAKSIFESNGYRFEMERMSNRLESVHYTSVRMDLYKGDEFIIGRDWTHQDNAIEQLITMIICDYEIYFTTFK